jgi:hypothetical protein
MDCPACGSPAIAFEIPAAFSDCTPADAPAAALCTRCLRLSPVDDATELGTPDFTRLSQSFPTGREGIAMALLTGLLDSLATYHDEIEGLVETLERAGTDPLLVLDRLDREPEIDPAVPLDKRRHQLQQVL